MFQQWYLVMAGRRVSGSDGDSAVKLAVLGTIHSSHEDPQIVEKFDYHHPCKGEERVLLSIASKPGTGDVTPLRAEEKNHLPIDLKRQVRIQAYQARQRQSAVAAHQSRSRQGSFTADHHTSHARRPSLTPSSPSPTCSPTPTSLPPPSISRRSSAHRLRAFRPSRQPVKPSCGAAEALLNCLPCTNSPRNTGDRSLLGTTHFHVWERASFRSPPARSLWLVLSQREERECPRYMYHGKMDVIERTLREGQVSSEGRVSRLARRREAVFGQVVEELEARGGASAAAEDDEEDEDNDENDDQGGGRRAYPYPNTKDLNMGVDGDDSSGVGDWAERASGNASGGELVDDMAGFLDRF